MKAVDGPRRHKSLTLASSICVQRRLRRKRQSGKSRKLDKLENKQTKGNKRRRIVDVRISQYHTVDFFYSGELKYLHQLWIGNHIIIKDLRKEHVKLINQ